MDGLEFLKRVRADSPHTTGIIMTDDDEITVEIDTSYSECVYRLVKKPLKRYDIKQAVKMAIAHYETNVGSKEHKTLRV